MPIANRVSPFLVLEHVTRSLVRETLWAACGTCTLLVGEYTPTSHFRYMYILDYAVLYK